MSIVEQQLVNIEIGTNTSGTGVGLRLNYQGQIYDLVQAFACHKLLQAEQKLQQLIGAHGEHTRKPSANRYLLVREVGYYSLWELSNLALGTENPLTSESNLVSESDRLSLQIASILLFQELWLRLEDLLGARQLKLLADGLLALTPQIESWVDLDRLLILDPLTAGKIGDWSEADAIAFGRQLYHLTQKKLGQKFGTELTIDIIQTMPEEMRSILNNLLELPS